MSLNWRGKPIRPASLPKRQPINRDYADLMRPLGEKQGPQYNVWGSAIVNVQKGGTTPSPTPTPFNQIYVGGSYTTFNGETRNRMLSLEESGVEVTSFYSNLGTGFTGTINDTLIQPDGKIVVANISQLNGNIRNRMVRLNADGTEDTAFYSNLSPGFSGSANSVNSIDIQSNGKIVAVGSFLTVGGVSSVRIVRINSDGTVDTAFSTNTGTGFPVSVSIVKVQSDDKILVGGASTTYNGNTRNRLVRLNSDGTEDTAFYTNLGTAFGSNVNGLGIQSDGKIVVVGSFTTFNGNTRNRIVRLNSDGTEDTTFYTNVGTGFGSTPNNVTIQSDGKIIVFGTFTTFNGNTRNRIVRLNSDGTEDTTFYTNLGTAFDSTISANSVSLQPDGKILIGGAFTTLDGNTRNRFVRLNSDGTEDTTFYGNLGTAFGGTVIAVDYKQNLPLPSPSPTPSISVTPSITPSITPSPSITPTPSITPSVSITPSITPTPSATPIPQFPDWDLNVNVGTDFMTALNFYFNESQTDVVSQFGSLAVGTDKWRGTVVASNNKLYGIPFGSTSVLELDTTTSGTTTFGSLGVDSDKWFGGVLAPNGFIYGVPYGKTTGTVLKINPSGNTVSTFGTVGTLISGKWVGGVLAPNGKIYCIPFNSTDVLIIDPTNDTTSTIASVNTLNSLGYMGAVLAPNGNIYCIPYNATTILVIDPTNNTTSTFGTISGSDKFIGGVLAKNGNIYCIPLNSTVVLKIDTTSNTLSTFGSLVGSAKWATGVLAPNGFIYGAPVTSTSILKIDTTNDTTSTFGTVSITGGAYVSSVLADNGKMYALPNGNTDILEVLTNVSGGVDTDAIFSRFLNKL